MIRVAWVVVLVACVTTRVPTAQEGQCGAPPRPVRGNNVYGEHGTLAGPRANPSR